MKRKTLFLLTLLLPIFANAQVVINEIMQSNIDCIMDDLNQFPDSWAEIYNGTESSINLSSYRIGLSDNIEEAYQLPEKEIPAKGYAIIYCDKESTGMHTDFRIDSGKGALYLFSNGAVVDKYAKIAKQPAPNIAYGRQTDGGDTFGYQATPTPGKANCGNICKDILGAPIFSEPGSVYSSKSFQVSLSLPEGSPEGTIIRYTLDGSEPTLNNGETYSNPITINNATRIIRATLFCDGYLSPRSKVQSYIYHNRTQTLPVISISLDNKYLDDNKIGIYVEGDYEDGKKNFNFDWRRPMNIELYETDGTTQSFNQLGELRIMGGQSRNWSLKSFAVYANKRFGEKRFNYEFFPDQRPGQKNYKSFLLRNAGNDFDGCYMRDAVIQRTMASHVDIDWQAWRPAIVYINGVYKGILNIRERSNDDNIYTNYNELEDIDMIENDYEVKAGTIDKYNAFKEFYNEHGHTMAEYAKWIDVEEMMNIYIMNLFYCNLDWPGNNNVIWRPTTEDGIFRYIAKDTDFGLGLYGRAYDYNTLEWIHNPEYDANNAWANGYEATRLFRSLEEDADFLKQFIDRCAIYMADFMNESGTWAVMEPMYNMVKTEYPFHRQIINPWWSSFDNEINNARQWIQKRPEAFYSQLATRYSLGNPTNLRLINNLSEEESKLLHFEANGIPLSGCTLNGKFFANRQLTISVRPLTAEELEAKGINSEVSTKEIESWNVMSDGTTRNFPGSTLSITMPNASIVVITPVYKNVETPEPDTYETTASIFGNAVFDTTNGHYIFKTPYFCAFIFNEFNGKDLASCDKLTINLDKGTIGYRLDVQIKDANGNILKQGDQDYVIGSETAGTRTPDFSEAKDKVYDIQTLFGNFVQNYPGCKVGEIRINTATPNDDENGGYWFTLKNIEMSYNTGTGIREITNISQDVYDITGRKSNGTRQSGLYIQYKKGEKPRKVVIR